jgi:hypothetical protein
MVEGSVVIEVALDGVEISPGYAREAGAGIFPS